MHRNHLSRSFSALLCSLIAIASTASWASVRLPQIFGSHMVLQQEKPLLFWGWADPGETVTVAFATDSKTVKANDRGEWKLQLNSRKAGGPFTIKISGQNEILLEDVLIGEVWLASGQSNMEMGIGACKDGKAEIAAADHPNIRLFMVANRWSPEPQDDLVKVTPADNKPENHWKICSPKTIGEGGWGGFSGAAYYFGRELQQQLNIPIGLIDATWGGTRIESWTPPEGFGAVPELKQEFEKVQLSDSRTPAHQQRLGALLQETEQWLSAARKAQATRAIVPTMPTFPAELRAPHELQHATALYNGMIHPVTPFPIRGFIWYQGESNSAEGPLYTHRMQALIFGWRTIWQDSALPFYYVQIAPYNYGGNPERIGEFWEAQAAAQSVPNSGMIVINDIGDLKDIHPTNKQDVGKRLAAWALAKQYGKNDIVYREPTFKSMTVEGNKLRVTFDNVAGGLASRDGKPLTWFEIIDAEEGGFTPAEARIEGNSVLLSSPEVQRPVAMRFAWSMLAEPNLMNSAGLPAGAFRAGEVPKRDLLGLKIREAKNYQLALDLDLAKLGSKITYDVDNRSKINSPIERVAYFLELQTADGNTDYLYVSMDAFTQSINHIGIPTADSGAKFQEPVQNLNVYSNVRGITTGTNLSGNIEFWPNNYGTANSGEVPNASAQVYDFGDQPSDPLEGYGSMQVHNFKAKQTLFALNHWVFGNKADIGIGNQTSGNPDWTFAGNAQNWKAKRLRVLVKTK